MKKLVSLILALAVVLSLCAPALAEKNPQLEVMVWYRDIDDLKFNEMPYYFDPENGINVQAGVDAKFNQVKAGDWSTKLNLMLNSDVDDYADIIMRGSINLEMYGVDQEILLPLDDYIKEYMPVYQSLLDADPELAKSLRSSDGKMYQIGWIIPQNINTDSHLFINKDWLAAAGLEVPTSIQELENALIAFRDLDVDGDGDPNNEIPYSGTFTSMVDGLHFLYSMWGIAPNDIHLSISDEGKVYSYLNDPALRAALETIHRWYDMDLIDIEAITQDMNSFEAKINAGRVGCFWRWRMTAMGTSEEVYNQYVCMMPPAAEGYSVRLPYYLEVPSFGAALTYAAEERGTVEAALTWMDKQFEFDNMINGYNGMKGEFWDYDENGIVEIFPMSDGTRTVPGQSSMYYMCGNDYFAKVAMPSHRVEKTTYCQNYTEAGLVEKISWRTLNRLVSLTVDESTKIELLYAEIDKFADESITNFIVKGVTDDGWNTYLKTLENLKLDEYISIYQGAYDRYVEANK